MHRLSLLYRSNTPLHVSGVSAAHNQEVECIYCIWQMVFVSKLTVSLVEKQIPFAKYIHSAS
jgi:hypothetical protein